MLVQGSFRSIRPLACIYRAPIMSFDFISSPSKSFFPILIAPFAFLNLLSFFFEFGKFSIELVSLIDKFSHLRHEHNVGQM